MKITLQEDCNCLRCMLSKKETWFGGCQSSEYMIQLNGIDVINLLRTGTTSAPSSPAGQFFKARDPEMKSF